MVKHSHHYCGGSFRVRFPGRRSVPILVRCADPGIPRTRIGGVGLPDDLYKIHLENERALAEAFDVARQACKNAIRAGKPRQEDVLTKNCALLLGAKLENTLLRIIYEPSGFDSERRRRIESAPTVADKWLRVVKEAFASRHDIPIGQVPHRLPFTAQARCAEMERLVKEQFIPLIELRNSLAHGQWHRTLNSSGTKVDPRRMAQLARQSVWRLAIQDNILHHVSLLIYDLVVTQTAFERDFDKRWNDLHSAITRLESSSGDRWVQKLRDRHDRRWGYLIRNARRGRRIDPAVTADAPLELREFLE